MQLALNTNVIKVITHSSVPLTVLSTARTLHIGHLHDERCITIIPELSGGLNEQPDELKKPGQLREAVNVIPDPVNGLTRRPGFALVPFSTVSGEFTTVDVIQRNLV